MASLAEVHCSLIIRASQYDVVEWLYHHFAWCLKSFWAFTVVMLSESSQVSKQSDALANPFPLVFDVPLDQVNHTNCWVEVFYYLDLYVGVIIMTLGVLENLAMLSYPQCDDSGHHSWKYPVMPFSSRYSTPVFLTQESLCSLRVDIVASSFRILVTFAIVLEVRGISFFQIPWTIVGRSSFEPKDHNQVLLTSSPFTLWICQSFSFCIGYPEEIRWTCSTY